MKLSLTLLALASMIGMAGCGSLPTTTFDNRVVCTVSGDKAYFISLYGPIGVAATVNSGDAERLCTGAPQAPVAASSVSK